MLLIPRHGGSWELTMELSSLKGITLIMTCRSSMLLWLPFFFKLPPHKSYPLPPSILANESMDDIPCFDWVHCEKCGRNNHSYHSRRLFPNIHLATISSAHSYISLVPAQAAWRELRRGSLSLAWAEEQVGGWVGGWGGGAGRWGCLWGFLTCLELSGIPRMSGLSVFKFKSEMHSKAR